jgi:ethanolamine transporter EutH
MVREKNILDRSSNDADVLKWIDIIFKQTCMLPGTFSDFLKLTFKFINRYLNKVGKSEFLPSAFNRLVEQHQKIGPIIYQKIQ